MLGLATPAAAQIYSWRDADGKLVLSDKPRRIAARSTTYAVPGARRSGHRALVPTRKSAPYEASISEHSRRQGVAADWCAP